MLARGGESVLGGKPTGCRKTPGSGRARTSRAHLPGTAAAVLRGSHVILSGCSGGETTGSLFSTIPFHESPLPPPLIPVRVRTWSWAPHSPFPHQTQRGHRWPEPIPTSPQPPGADAGLWPPAFCHRGGMQQCCEGKLPAAALAPKAATQDPTPEHGYKQPQGFNGEEEGAPGWQISETPRGGEQLPCQHRNPVPAA